MRGMSQLRPTFTQLPLSVILSGVRSRRLSAVYPTIDSSLTPEERKTLSASFRNVSCKDTNKKVKKHIFIRTFKHGTIESRVLWLKRIIEQKNLPSWIINHLFAERTRLVSLLSSNKSAAFFKVNSFVNFCKFLINKFLIKFPTKCSLM